MNAQTTLDACGLEELDGAAMLAVNGGIIGELTSKIFVGVFICVINSSDAIIDGIKAGWAAASA